MSLEEIIPGALLILAIMVLVAVGFAVDWWVRRRPDWEFFFSPAVVKVAIGVLAVVGLCSCALLLYAGLLAG